MVEEAMNHQYLLNKDSFKTPVSDQSVARKRSSCMTMQIFVPQNLLMRKILLNSQGWEGGSEGEEDEW